MKTPNKHAIKILLQPTATDDLSLNALSDLAIKGMPVYITELYLSGKEPFLILEPAKVPHQSTTLETTVNVDDLAKALGKTNPQQAMSNSVKKKFKELEDEVEILRATIEAVCKYVDKDVDISYYRDVIDKEKKIYGPVKVRITDKQ